MKHSNETIQQILNLHEQGLSSRSISDIVFGRKSAKSTVNDIINRYKGEREWEDLPVKPKVLFLDLEVQGSLNISFPRFKAFISPDAVIEEPYLLTAAWNWLGDDEIVCKGLNDYPLFRDEKRNDISLVEELWELLDHADVVIAHNASFDVGWLNNRFAYHYLPPPSPYKVVCTLKALKKHFKLPSNSLDASTKYFEVSKKQKHEGISLWVDCFKGDEDAFKKMKRYNIGDIPTLKDLYMRIRAFITNHPNISLMGDDPSVCGTCGEGKMVEVLGKYAYTNLSKFKTYRCDCCGTIKRNRVNQRAKEDMQQTLMNVV